MAKTIKEERLRWVLPIANKEVRLVDAAKVCPYGKRSLERWLSVYRKEGEDTLKPKSTKSKTQPNETSIRIKERVIEIRRQTRKCALKIKWQLEAKGALIDERTVGKILRAEGLTRKYRTRKIHWQYVRIPLKKGELVEIDVKYVPERIKWQRYYQFTAIGYAIRWRYMKAYEDESTFSVLKFLIRRCLAKLSNVAIKDLNLLFHLIVSAGIKKRGNDYSFPYSFY